MPHKNPNLIAKALLLVLITGTISLFTANLTAFAADEIPEFIDPFATDDAAAEEEDDSFPQLETDTGDETPDPTPPSTPKSGPELMYLLSISGLVAGANIIRKARK